MNRSPHKPRDPECIALRIEMLKQSVSYHDLAERTGLASGTVANVVSGTNSHALSRFKLNQALGVSIFTLPKKCPDSRKQPNTTTIVQ